MQRNVWERWKYNTTVLSITINFPSSGATTDNTAAAETTATSLVTTD